MQNVIHKIRRTSYATNGNRPDQPFLRIQGEYLREIGMPTGTPVHVQIQPGKITISLWKEEDPKWTS